MSGIQVNDEELRELLKAANPGQRQPRRVTFSAEQKRRASIIVMAAIKDLTQAQRTQVLRHALKVNKV